MTTQKSKLINDSQRFIGAVNQFGRALKTYDDGYGALWISIDSMGINGIVRASSLEQAYGICEDEFFSEASESIDELIKEYGFKREHVKIIKPADGSEERPAILSDYPLAEGQFVRWETIETPDPDAWTENDLFCEAYGFRPNGANEGDVQKHGIYQKDLNGDYLEELTPELLSELEITLELENEE